MLLFQQRIFLVCNFSIAGVSSAKNRNVSQSGNYLPSPQTTQPSHLQATHQAQYLNHPHQHLSSLLTSSNREASPPTVCCYTSSNSNILSNTFRGGSNSNQNLVNSNSSNNKNQNKSNLIRYNSRAGSTQIIGGSSSKRNCDNSNLEKGSSKIRVKSDPCLGGLSVNLVQINDKESHEVVDDDDDGKNHHKLLLLNTKSSSPSSYVIGSSVSTLKNRTAAATVLCKPTTTTTTPSTDYSNNFCVNNNSNNNNNKTKVNYSSKSRTKTELPLLLGENTRNTASEKLENLNLLNCFTSKVAHHHRRRDSRSSSVCLDASSGSCASENSLNTSVLSEDLSTDVSLSSSLHKSNSELSRKSSLTTNSLKNSDSKIKYARNGNLLNNNNKLLAPSTTITSAKKPTDFHEFRQEINNSDVESKQIICANLNDHANNLNFIDCSSSGEVSLNDDPPIIRPLPPYASASPKRSFLHTIPTVSSSLLTLSNEIPNANAKICANNNQTNIDFNQKNQIKLKEFYEQKTLSATTDLHKFKSNSNNANQQQHSHVRYKTIASEYPNIGWNPNENYPNNQIFYESVTNNNNHNNHKNIDQNNSEQIKLISNNNNGSYLIDPSLSNIKQVPATVPRNNNSNKSLNYYQSQQINGGNGTSQLTKSQQDLQKQVRFYLILKMI